MEERPDRTPEDIDHADVMQQLELQHQWQNGARWFWWIAALSLINSVIAMANGSWGFIVGLGITQFVDGIAIVLQEEGSTAPVKFYAAAVNAVVIAVFILFGFKAREGYRWAFFTGMVVYAFDGLILGLVQDWWGVAFHVFVMLQVWNGLKALRAHDEIFGYDEFEEEPA
jgi:hypothetical protein